jgi:uncharacterized membrane protein YhaH (DUF805 family)
MEWYLKVLRNYANFEGRARRKEYWMFVLFNVLAAVVIAIIDSVLHTRTASGLGILGLVYSLAVLLPGIAVAARRLHDRDMSGWWLLLSFIPIIGTIIVIVWLALEGNRGSNRFGSDPKAADGGAPVMA